MKRDQHTDAALVKAYLLGDKSAMAKLVKRWHLTFCQKAFWIVKDPELAKDIAQESWQVIIDKLDKLKDVNSFGAWALRIVCSKSFDALRQQVRKRHKDQELEYSIAEDENTDSGNDDEQLKASLLQAVKALSEQQQMVVKLFYTESYSLKDISKTLDISVGTVKSRLFHAREKLKQILKDKT
ncbi:sigma-70 family RNA polymerase sigma factor [uncultured Psychroserpens sp.]|uniref:RNA polymerase sigma factor n=1 Tax=uncultured Psychroserpens sp. TaxID=255436 RepID=UPI002607A1A4|nr:sigma-70 family RNA polymerase sigma factor [uncultured Psychroserpens sp.]